MSEVNGSNVLKENTTMVVMSQEPEEEDNVDFMTIVSAIIASVGVVANLTVVVAFARHKELRQKIPVIFVINQVRYIPRLWVFSKNITILTLSPTLMIPFLYL